MKHSISYALGMNAAKNLVDAGLKEINIEDFTNALKGVILNETLEMTPEESVKTINDYFAGIEKERAEARKKMANQFKVDGETFLSENATKDGVVVLPSGLQYKVITEGDGEKPNANSVVKCHYEGRFTNGNVFDSSYKRNAPATFGLNQVIPGWTEGLQLMSVGSKYEFYIPYSLGYGENGMPNAIPPYAALVFTVELLNIEH